MLVCKLRILFHHHPGVGTHCGSRRAKQGCPLKVEDSCTLQNLLRYCIDSFVMEISIIHRGKTMITETPLRGLTESDEESIHDLTSESHCSLSDFSSHQTCILYHHELHISQHTLLTRECFKNLAILYVHNTDSFHVSKLIKLLPTVGNCLVG